MNHGCITSSASMLFACTPTAAASVAYVCWVLGASRHACGHTTSFNCFKTDHMQPLHSLHSRAVADLMHTDSCMLSPATVLCDRAWRMAVQRGVRWSRQHHGDRGGHSVQVHGAGELYMKDVTLHGGPALTHGSQALHVASFAFAQGVPHNALPPFFCSKWSASKDT